MNYRVVYNHPRIQKHFVKELGRASSSAREKITKAVLDLAREPRPHGVIKMKPPLDVFHCLAQYRITVDNYRIFYDIDDNKKCVPIIALRKRNEKTYRDL